MIRVALFFGLLIILAAPVAVRAQQQAGVLDSLIDTENIPRPLLAEYEKAYLEDWVWFGGGHHQNYFFLPRTLETTTHGAKRVWSVNVQDADGTDWMSARTAMIEQQRQAHRDPHAYARYLLTKIQWEVDCAGQRARIIQLIDIDEDGGVIWSRRVNGKLEDRVPNSRVEALLQAVCSPTRQITFRDIVHTPLGEQVLPEQ